MFPTALMLYSARPLSSTLQHPTRLLALRLCRQRRQAQPGCCPACRAAGRTFS